MHLKKVNVSIGGILDLFSSSICMGTTVDRPGLLGSISNRFCSELSSPELFSVYVVCREVMYSQVGISSNKHKVQ